MEEARLAGVPAPVVERVLALGMEYGWPPEKVAPMLQALSSCAEQSLPPEALAEKIDEGAAKGASPDVIVAVLDRHLAALESAALLLGQKETLPVEERAGLLQALAKALLLDIAEGRLAIFIANGGRASPEILRIALEQAVLLGQMGFTAGDALDALSPGVESGNLSPEWGNLFGVAATARASGRADGEILEALRLSFQEGDSWQRFKTLLGVTERNLRLGPERGRMQTPAVK